MFAHFMPFCCPDLDYKRSEKLCNNFFAQSKNNMHILTRGKIKVNLCHAFIFLHIAIPA